MGFAEPCFRRHRRGLCRQALQSAVPAHGAASSWSALKEQGWQRLDVPERFAPFAEGGFPTPSGKCEFYSETARGAGLDPLPTYTPPREIGADARPSWRDAIRSRSSRRRARNFLNSSFANLPLFLDAEKEPHARHPSRRRARRAASATATGCACSTTAGPCARARVTDKARPGGVVAPSVWWKKLSPDGTNANDVTSQRLADMGRGDVLRRASGSGAGAGAGRRGPGACGQRDLHRGAMNPRAARA